MRTREGDKGQDILKAAIEVIAREGYHDARISRIAEEAGVSAGTVYLYYENKESLLHAILEVLWQDLASRLTALMRVPDLPPMEKLDRAIDLYFDVCAQNPSLAVVFVNEQSLLLQQGTGTFIGYYQAFIDDARALIEQGINDGVFNSQLDVKVLHHFIIGGLHSLIHQWARDPQTFPLSGLRKGAKYFVRHGLLRTS